LIYSKQKENARRT